MPVEVGGERQQRAGVEVPAAGHGQAHAEEQHPVVAVFHALDQRLEVVARHPGYCLDVAAHGLAAHPRAQRPQQLEVAPGAHLHELVGDRRRRRLAHVHQHHVAVLLAVRDVAALGRHRVAREVPRVRLGRVAAPVDHQVGAVLDLAQGGGALADALEGDARGTVADRGGGVDGAAHQIADRHRHALRLARRVAEPVGDREPGLVQDARGLVQRVLERRLLAADQRRRVVLDAVLQEPGAAEHAGVLGLGDALRVEVDGQLHVVAHAAAEGAGGVLDDADVGRRRGPARARFGALALAHCSPPRALRGFRPSPAAALPPPAASTAACRSRRCRSPSARSTTGRRG